MTPLKRAKARAFSDQIDAGIRAAAPIAIQKAKARVERAAMRFYKTWGKWYLDNQHVLPNNPGLQLSRACATLGKLTKGKK